MIKFIAFSDLLCTVGNEASDMKKLSAVCDKASGCEFVASLGNAVDGSADKEKSLALFGKAMKLCGASAPVYAVMGSRDTVISKREFAKAVGCAMRYIATEVSDYRCIFLDTCAGDEADPYNADTSRGFSVDDEQIKWLSRLLDRSHRPAIIFSHAPLAVSDPADEKYLPHESSRLRELIESSNKVALVVSGCMDKSDRVVSNGVPYITLAPMNSVNEVSFAKISVSSTGIEAFGFGAQESFSVTKASEPKKQTLKDKIRALFKKGLSE